VEEIWSAHVGCGRGCCLILSVGDGPAHGVSRGPGRRGAQPRVPLCHHSLGCGRCHVVHRVSPCCHVQWDSALSQGAVSPATMFLLVIPPSLLADLPVRSHFSSQALIPIKAARWSLAQPAGYGSRRGALGGSLPMRGHERLQQRHACVGNQLHAPQPSARGSLLERRTSGSTIMMCGCTPKKIWLGRSPSAEGSLAGWQRGATPQGRAGTATSSWVLTSAFSPLQVAIDCPSSMVSCPVMSAHSSTVVAPRGPCVPSVSSAMGLELCFCLTPAQHPAPDLAVLSLCACRPRTRRDRSGGPCWEGWVPYWDRYGPHLGCSGVCRDP